MAANNKVLHGARCVLLIEGNPVGVFTSVQYGVNYAHQPIYILGRSSASEIAMTGMDVVTVTAHGWRVMDHGPFAGSGGNGTAGGEIGMPKLQDLLTKGTISVALVDRIDGASGNNQGRVFMQVDQCRVVNFSSQMQARQAQDFSVTFVGLSYSDEAGQQNEPSFSIDLPA